VHACDPVAAKRTVRQEFLALRRALPTDVRAAADAAILTRVVAELRGCSVVAAYVPVGTEPGSTEPGGTDLPEALRRGGLEVLLPVLEPDGDLDWAVYDGRLERAARGLRQPPGPRQGRDAVARADAVIVPAVAVDRQGVRLGRGGGSYDRALARLTPGVTGTVLLYDGELVDVLPSEAHDRAVGTVITPTTVYRVPAGTGRTATPSTG
jgi:5-formyltetrahydrofolate cyclo-ligase